MGSLIPSALGTFGFVKGYRAATGGLFNSVVDALDTTGKQDQIKKDELAAAKQKKVDDAQRAYLDTRAGLLTTPGRRDNLLADPVQAYTKFLGKSVL